jgi:hypothetical protein
MTNVGEIARMLADRAPELARDLLPGGRREGAEWRCGSIAGEAGQSLAVHLAGPKAGVWSDFSTGQAGDALDLVRAVFGFDMHEALVWSHRWLGLEDGEVAVPQRLAPTAKPEPELDPQRWARPWQSTWPIAGSPAEVYLVRRGLTFADPESRVLRYASRRARFGPDGQLEHHPAMLAALCDVRTGGQVGIVNVFLRPDGSDRLRDRKGKTNTGRAGGAAVMLSPYDDVTMGLTICEGFETGCALLLADLAPVWALGGAGNLKSFPVLAGIEALTIAADADEPGQNAAASVAQRWRSAGREAVIIAPPIGDWADPRRPAA